MQSLTTVYDDKTLALLDRLVAEGNFPSREAFIQDAIQRRVQAFEQFEAEVQVGLDEIKEGKYCTHDEVLEEMRGLGVSI